MPLTDEDLARIAALITESEARTLNRLEGRLDAVEARINDRISVSIEDSATKLLTAFHQWASPMDQRARSHAAAIRALDLECEALDGRITKLEPPH